MVAPSVWEEPARIAQRSEPRIAPYVWLGIFLGFSLGICTLILFGVIK